MYIFIIFLKLESFQLQTGTVILKWDNCVYWTWVQNRCFCHWLMKPLFALNYIVLYQRSPTFLAQWTGIDSGSRGLGGEGMVSRVCARCFHKCSCARTHACSPTIFAAWFQMGHGPGVGAPPVLYDWAIGYVFLVCLIESLFKCKKFRHSKQGICEPACLTWKSFRKELDSEISKKRGPVICRRGLRSQKMIVI